jgi:hypothetical protein
MTASFGTRGSQVQILPLRPIRHRNGTETPPEGVAVHIPGKSKSFKRWWQRHAASAPPELQIAAGRACATLEALEMKTKRPASRAYMELCARDLAAFASAWAEHREAASSGVVLP